MEVYSKARLAVEPGDHLRRPHLAGGWGDGLLDCWRTAQAVLRTWLPERDQRVMDRFHVEHLATDNLTGCQQ